MRSGSTIADPPVPVTLRDQEMLRRGRRLAEKIGVRTDLVEAKKAENKKRQEEIDELDEEIAAEARVIIDGFENRNQGDLFVDQALPPAQATQRLAELEARAAKHPFVADAEKIDTCGREGCGAQQGSDVHVAPPPAKPHTFAGDGTGEGKCWACGSGKDDPVHGEQAWREEVAAASAAGIETANTPANETIEIAATLDCSRCGKNVPRAEVLYDAGVQPVCESCKRAGIEAGTWPHPFRKGHQKAKRCADCNGRADDAVHNVPPVEATAEETQHSAELAAATGDPAYDFDVSDPPPDVAADAAEDEATAKGDEQRESIARGQA